MFESLDEQLRLEHRKTMSSKERMIPWVLGIAIVLIVFCALYWGIHMMQGG
jgi:hypothetical protein